MNFNEATKSAGIGRKVFYSISDIIQHLGGEVDISLTDPLKSCAFTIIDLEVSSFSASSTPSEIALIQCAVIENKITFRQHGPLMLSNPDDLEVATSLLQQIKSDASWLVAHNASSDRRYLANQFPFMREHLRWMCTLNDIRWENYGYNAKNLEYLLFKNRLFYEAHNSLQDAQAVLALLTAHPKELTSLQLDQSVIKISNIKEVQVNVLVNMGFDVSLKNHSAKVTVSKGMVQAEIENLLSVGIDRPQISFI